MKNKISQIHEVEQHDIIKTQAHMYHAVQTELGLIGTTLLKSFAGSNGKPTYGFIRLNSKTYPKDFHHYCTTYTEAHPDEILAVFRPVPNTKEKYKTIYARTPMRLYVPRKDINKIQGELEYFEALLKYLRKECESQIRYPVLLTSQYMIDYNSDPKHNDLYTTYQFYSTCPTAKEILMWKNLKTKSSLGG